MKEAFLLFIESAVKRRVHSIFLLSYDHQVYT